MHGKTALLLTLALASTFVFTCALADGPSADVGPFSGKAGEGENGNIRAEYYTHSYGVFRPALYVYLDGGPSVQASVLVSTSPVQKIEPVEARSQFAVYLDQPLEMSGSPYHLLLKVFGIGTYIADCYIHVHGGYHTVSFDSNGGTGYMEPVETGTGAYVLPSCGFTPPGGMTFRCWKVDGAEHSVGDTVDVTSDVTVLAVWGIDHGSSYRVNVYASPSRGGTVTGAGSYRAGETATLIASASRGYTFSNWYQDGRMVSASATYNLTVFSDASLTAVFTESGTPTFVYSVTYDANGGYDAPNKQMKRSDAREVVFSISPNSPKHAELSFKGWSLSPDGPVRYFPKDPITLYSSNPEVVLYAKWGAESAPSAIEIGYTSLIMPPSSSITLSARMIPEDSAPVNLVWTSSDESVVSVSQAGTVASWKEGTAVIAVTTDDGSLRAECFVTVTSSGRPAGGSSTEGGGSVEWGLSDDGHGGLIAGNPITINLGESGRITGDQERLALDLIGGIQSAGTRPDVVIRTSGTEIKIPWTISSAIAESYGSLTVIEGNVTLFFSSAVMRGMGASASGMTVCVIPMMIDDVGIDSSRVPNSLIFDIFILINGTRYSMSFAEPVLVTVDYAMEGGRDPGRLYVYHLDPDPMENVEFEYAQDTGVSFGVMHFSIYAVGCEDDSGISPWFILAAAIPLASIILFLIPWRRRRKEDEEDIYENPYDPDKYTRSQSKAR
ncbi:MAG: hypothetical protein E7Z69_02245 [Thermoplasmata archaeon]|nr:hypothetical protein [Thermoplasmata archaeon]